MAKKKVETEDAGVKPEAIHIGGESLLDRILPHIKKIFVAIMVITVILVGFFTWRWWVHRGQSKDTEAMARSLDVLRRDVVEPPAEDTGSGSGAGSGSGSVATPIAPKPDDKTFASYQARAETGLKQLSGPVGDVFRANLLFDAGKLDQAEALYKRAANRKDLEGTLAREGLGFVAEARAHEATDAGERQKQLEAALARFGEIADSDGPHGEYKYYHVGRIQALLDHRTDASASLEKALEIDPDSELAPLIEQRLAQLEAMK